MQKNPIPLEDDPCDVLKKAMRGMGIDAYELAEKSNLSLPQINCLLDGDTDKDHLTRAGDALGLNGYSLSILPDYRPNATCPHGLHQIVSPFGHAGVNAYIIEHDKSATVIDTGTDATQIFQTIRDCGLKIACLLITHRHPDHTACVQDFQGIPIVYPDQVEHNDSIKTERGKIKALDVSGHASPARAFYYDQLETPICIVGDAIFAGSMGGTQSPNSYQLASKTSKEHIMQLPSNTIICPGHGPITTVSQEAQHNPFFK